MLPRLAPTVLRTETDTPIDTFGMKLASPAVWTNNSLALIVLNRQKTVSNPRSGTQQFSG